MSKKDYWIPIVVVAGVAGIMYGRSQSQKEKEKEETKHYEQTLPAKTEDMGYNPPENLPPNPLVKNVRVESYPSSYFDNFFNRRPKQKDEL